MTKNDKNIGQKRPVPFLSHERRKNEEGIVKR